MGAKPLQSKFAPRESWEGLHHQTDAIWLWAQILSVPTCGCWKTRNRFVIGREATMPRRFLFRIAVLGYLLPLGHPCAGQALHDETVLKGAVVDSAGAAI